jgi:hypothetical protein
MWVLHSLGYLGRQEDYVPAPFAAACQIGPTLSGNATGAFFYTVQMRSNTFVELLEGDLEKTYVWVSSDPNQWFVPIRNNEEVVWAAGPQDPMYWKIQLPSGAKIIFYIGTNASSHSDMPARPLPRG